MPGYIFKKTSRGKKYYYAGESQRVKGKNVRKWEVYLGTFDKIVKTMTEGILLPSEVSATPYGLYSAFNQIGKEIDFVQTVNNIFPKREQGLTKGDYFLIGILARLAKPISKNSVKKWYTENKIEKIYPVDPKLLTVQNYWNNMVTLDFEQINELHHHLLCNLSKTKDIQTTYIYFDPSNFHTYIDVNTMSEGTTLPQHGNSKKKRFDLRQVNLALAVTKGDGIPVYHKTYSGNINDVTFFKKHFDAFIEHLKKTTASKEIVIVFDKGNNTEEVFDKLANYKEPRVQFIGSLRPSSQKLIFKTPIEELKDSYTTSSGNIVRYREFPVSVYGRSYRGILTYDEKTYRRKWNT